MPNDPLPRLAAAPGIVRGDNQARDVARQQGVALAWRFHAQHVGGGTAQVAAAQRLGQGLFVDQATAGGVDHEGAGFELGQFAGSDKVSRVFVERAVQGQRIDLWQQLVKRQAVWTGRASGNLPQQDAHAEGFGQPPDGAAQFTVAQQSQGLALQLDDRVVQQAELRSLLPATCTDRFLVVGQSCRQVQQQHDRVLGHRRRAVALAIAHGDAMAAGGHQIDIVGAGGADQDQLQSGVGGHRGRVDHHFVGDRHGGALEPFGHLLRRGAGEQLQRVEAVAQRLQVQVAEVQGRVIEENGAGGVCHQLYLLCLEPKA